jgi:hypothetical protein
VLTPTLPSAGPAGVVDLVTSQGLRAARQGGEPWHLASNFSALALPAMMDTRRGRRSQRNARRSKVWGWSDLKRSAVKDPDTGERWAAAPVFCGRVAIGNAVEVHREVDTTTGDAEAFVAGVQTCRSVWVCPVCSAAIRDGRARQLTATIGEHLARGGGLYMATLTLRHRAGDDLALMLGILATAWTRAAASTRAAQDWRKRLGWLGAVRAVEVTYGRNGWHPHLHVLIFTRGRLSDDLEQGYGAWLAAAWQEKVVGLGGRVPSEAVGVHLAAITSGESAGEYVAKVQDGDGEAVERNVAAELLRGDLKQARRNRHGVKGLVPFQLLDLIGDTEQRVHDGALRAWHEYEHATKGRRCITGLSPLSKLYGVADPSDAALAAADQEPTDPDEHPEVVRSMRLLPAGIWRNLCRAGLHVRYLDVVELFGHDAGEAVIAEATAWGRANPPDPSRWP